MQRVLHQFECSPYCTKVRAVLHLKQLRYTTVEVLPKLHRNLGAMPGHSQLPMLIDDTRRICDSTEIALYIDTAYPEGVRLVPEDPRGYRECFLWEDWSDEALGPMVVWALLDHARRNPAFARELLPPLGNQTMEMLLRRGLPVFLPLIQARYRLKSTRDQTNLNRLDRALDFLAGSVAATSNLVGERTTLADVAVATMTRHLHLLPRYAGRHTPYRRLFQWRDGVLDQCLIQS